MGRRSALDGWMDVPRQSAANQLHLTATGPAPCRSSSSTSSTGVEPDTPPTVRHKWAPQQPVQFTETLSLGQGRRLYSTVSASSVRQRGPAPCRPTQVSSTSKWWCSTRGTLARNGLTATSADRLVILSRVGPCPACARSIDKHSPQNFSGAKVGAVTTFRAYAAMVILVVQLGSAWGRRFGNGALPPADLKQSQQHVSARSKTRSF